ncbi:MAG: glycosyl hydrolase family protein [Ruminococcaceae bacterium]|nr:glycosyl hydrolase family protein [Oscillospiraceae bacterium]
MKKPKLYIITAALLCAAALTMACTDKTDAPPETTADVTAEVTSPDTKEETQAMTEEKTTTEETTEGETDCRILFEDHFDGTELDATKWTKCPEGESPDGAIWEDELSSLDGNGHLVLSMTLDEATGKLKGGAIKSEGLFAYGYGYYEACIRFSTPGTTGGFSIIAGDPTATAAADGTKISVVQSQASNTAPYSHVLSWNPEKNKSSTPAVHTANNIYDGLFHTFGVLRSEDGYTFYVDGVESATFPSRRLTPCALDGYLQLACGATDGSMDHLLPNDILVDYVRVYSSLPETLDKAVNAEATPVFSDDFDGTELDATKWEKCPEWERQGKSQWKNDLSYVDGEGNLVLKMEWDETTQLVNCGAVRTLGRFAYGYGYYEARMKFTPHHGAWGAFWMMCGNVSSEVNGATDGVEIDIIESIDNQNGIYNHNLHWDGYGAAHKSAPPSLLTKIDIYDGEYHTFGMLRNETGYYFYIDGMLSGFILANQCEACPADGYIKLTCESAEWSGGGSPECIADMPAEVFVDYVRVYDTMPVPAVQANP